MPRHLAIDTNYIGGTVSIVSAKTATINYTNAAGNPVLFTTAPRITLTMTSSTTAVPFKTLNVKTGALFSGFKIGFQTNVTADIEWVASERI